MSSFKNFVILCLVAISCEIFLLGNIQKQNIYLTKLSLETTRAYNTRKVEILKQKPKLIRLGFVGDIMLDRDVERSVDRNGNGDYHYIFSNIKDTLGSFDILFGNLEGPVSTQTKVCGSMYSFNMATSVAEVLRDENFKIVSLANNHMFDYCYSGFQETLKNLFNANVEYVGAGQNINEAYTPKILLVDDLKIAFLAASEFGKNYMDAGDDRGGIAIIDTNRMCSEINNIRSEVDLVAISLHFGEEYKTELNSYQRNVATKLIDCGADLIIGSHPHVVEPLEKYKNGYIAYSLGNFIFDQNFSPETMQGGILDVLVKDKKISTVNILPTKQNQFYQPELTFIEN